MIYAPHVNPSGDKSVGHPSGGLRCVEEFPHSRSCCGVAGALCYAEAFEHEAENALVLVEGDRFVYAFGKRANHDSDHVTTAGSEVVVRVDGKGVRREGVGQREWGECLPAASSK
jgi:hypothetical protein